MYQKLVFLFKKKFGKDGMTTEILAETPDFIAAAKPPGIETASQDSADDFLRRLRDARQEPGISPVHRLDRDTSGLQIMARNPAAEKLLTDLFRQRAVEKTYLALCLGVPRNRTGVINRNLSEWSGGRRPVRILKKGGLIASTGYAVLAASDWLADDFRVGLLAFFPHQGRTHQIRVHAGAFGYPILGDDQYGDRPANRLAKQLLGLDRQALHAWKTSFPWNGKQFKIVCPPPEDLRQAIAKTFADAIDIAALPTDFS